MLAPYPLPSFVRVWAGVRENLATLTVPYMVLFGLTLVGRKFQPVSVVAIALGLVIHGFSVAVIFSWANGTRPAPREALRHGLRRAIPLSEIC